LSSFSPSVASSTAPAGGWSIWRCGSGQSDVIERQYQVQHSQHIDESSYGGGGGGGGGRGGSSLGVRTKAADEATSFLGGDGGGGESDDNDGVFLAFLADIEQESRIEEEEPLADAVVSNGDVQKHFDKSAEVLAPLETILDQNDSRSILDNFLAELGNDRPLAMGLEFDPEVKNLLKIETTSTNYADVGNGRYSDKLISTCYPKVAAVLDAISHQPTPNGLPLVICVVGVPNSKKENGPACRFHHVITTWINEYVKEWQEQGIEVKVFVASPSFLTCVQDSTGMYSHILHTHTMQIRTSTRAKHTNTHKHTQTHKNKQDTHTHTHKTHTHI